MPKERLGIWEAIHRVYLLSWIIERVPWTIVLSGALSIIIAYWALVADWVAKYGYLPVFVVALIVFVFGIWGFNGIVWIRRQQRPSRKRVTFDYSYGLVVEKVEAAYDKNNPDNMLEMRVHLRNHVSGPITFRVSQLNYTIGDRFYRIPKPVTGTLARVEMRTIFPGGGFHKDAFDSFREVSEGRLDIEVIYGHPEDGYSRKMTKELLLQLFKREDDKHQLSVTLNWLILSEEDVELGA